MSTGVLTHYSLDGRGTIVRLLENVGAANSTLPANGVAGDIMRTRPSATQFFDLEALEAHLKARKWTFPTSSSLRIYETGASTGALSISYARVWLYDKNSMKSYPAGAGTDADKGKMNGAVAFGITGTGQLRHQESLLYPNHWDGIQVELGVIGGTTPTFNVDWFIPAVY